MQFLKTGMQKERIRSITAYLRPITITISAFTSMEVLRMEAFCNRSGMGFFVANVAHERNKLYKCPSH